MPSPVKTVLVRLGARSYPIWIGERLVAKGLWNRLKFLEPVSGFFLVADRRLEKIADRMARQLGERCAGRMLLPGGERSKDLATVFRLYAAAAAARLDRKSVVIALGGGVIGDAVGFFAATYLRGLRVVQVPTTLMAQVDSAVGGKTGVNLFCGKNLVGAFHQPSAVAVDPSLLKTLPDREFRSGLAEVIKYGVIADAPLFRRLEARMDRILQRQAPELAWIIARCCAIKADVVSRDERETTGLRATLNFGHTLGHGIEAATRYGAFRHGEAVAVGMVGATALSCFHAGLAAREAARIASLIGRTGLPSRISARRGAGDSQKILAAMRLDKKASHGRIRFVLARRIGSVTTGVPIPEDEILRVLGSLAEMGSAR